MARTKQTKQGHVEQSSIDGSSGFDLPMEPSERLVWNRQLPRRSARIAAMMKARQLQPQKSPQIDDLIQTDPEDTDYEDEGDEDDPEDTNDEDDEDEVDDDFDKDITKEETQTEEPSMGENKEEGRDKGLTLKKNQKISKSRRRSSRSPIRN
jgi:hypothetical protein